MAAVSVFSIFYTKYSYQIAFWSEEWILRRQLASWTLKKSVTRPSYLTFYNNYLICITLSAIFWSAFCKAMDAHIQAIPMCIPLWPEPAMVSIIVWMWEKKKFHYKTTHHRVIPCAKETRTWKCFNKGGWCNRNICLFIHDISRFIA